VSGAPDFDATSRAFTLVVTAGPDKGKSFPIDPDAPMRTLIGQSPACVVQLTDKSVSRRHAALERVGGSLRITDLDSTNGTFVDRVKVREADLQGDELIRVGASMLRVDTATADATSLPESDRFGRLLGGSREMRRLYPLCRRLARSDVPVIVEGETGTGKEVLAEAIHEEGPRADGPFVVFDCTTCSSNLVESELFGHERGAFTGATSQRKGVFEQADGGTLFIDEIGDLDLSLQPKLLRALERSEIRRVGGDRWIQVNVRIIAATRRNLDREVEAGRFRDDLFHRIAVSRIELPPLRHRQGEIRFLVKHFWRDLGGRDADLTEELLRKWEDSPWAGNVRALRNAVARQLALGDLPAVVPSDSAPSASAPVSSTSDADPYASVIAAGLPYPQARDRVLAEFEQRYVAHVLEQHGGDAAAAAAASGIGRRYFQKLRARGRRG
jgi:DNA-binding NtrC family response regulator